LTFTPNAYGRVWHLAGAGVTTQRAIIEEIERQIGHRLRVRVAGKAMLRMLGLFNPLMREMVEMHYLFTHPVLMDDSALQRLLGPIHKTPYSDGIRECLAGVRASRNQSPRASPR
jgi:nucleoside-diphosphate-sugar epimerase